MATSPSVGAQPAGSGRAIDAAALSKLRWRCRRGLLENDLLIERLFTRAAPLTQADDAIYIDTTSMPIDAVVHRVLMLVMEKLE